MPADPTFAPIMVEGFTRAGWQPRLLAGVDGLREAAESPHAALVILDMHLRGAQEALRALKLRDDVAAPPVVAIFPRGSDPRHPPHLRVRAEVELVEPVALAHLVATAQQNALRSAQPVATRKVRLVLPSSRGEMDAAVEILSRLLRTASLPETAHTSFLAAIREAIANAIQHGNRNDPAMVVRVEYHQNPAAVTVAVRDEGPGFDARRLLREAIERDAAEAARDRHRQGGKGGLGLLMLLRCADQVRYNDTGNLVNLTKFLRHDQGPRPRPQPAP